MLGLFNLSLDDWPGVVFDLDADAGRGVKRIQRLDAQGRWRTDPAIKTRRRAGRWQVRADLAVSHRLPLILRVERS